MAATLATLRELVLQLLSRDGVFLSRNDRHGEPAFVGAGAQTHRFVNAG
jgi:hypothetical protein